MTLRDLKKKVAKLPRRKLAAFRVWFYKFDAANKAFEFIQKQNKHIK